MCRCAKTQGRKAAPAAADTAYRVLLMQLVLGSPPWNMSAGVALANWLCLSALYWIGCAIIGYPAVCCVLLHILAGMWGAANYFRFCLPRHTYSAVGL